MFEHDPDLLKLLPDYLDAERLVSDHPRWSVEEVHKALGALVEASAPARSVTVAPGEQVERVVLYTDGGSRGNPGPAGIGVLLLDGEETLVEVAEPIGVATNNVAEYRAVIRGLEEACRLGVKTLELRMDSQLIVRQIQGQYRVKHPLLKPLHAAVMDRLRTIDRWSVTHVRREFNSRADALANEGMGNSFGT